VTCGHLACKILPILFLCKSYVSSVLRDHTGAKVSQEYMGQSVHNTFAQNNTWPILYIERIRAITLGNSP
jgi:hypothetical protein